jgi:hypothetical protein
VAKKKTTKAEAEKSVGSDATADAPSFKPKKATKVRSKKKTKGSPRARRVTKKAAEKGQAEIAGPETSPAPAPTTVEAASPKKTRKTAAGAKKATRTGEASNAEPTLDLVASPEAEAAGSEAFVQPTTPHEEPTAEAVDAPVRSEEHDPLYVTEILEIVAGEDADTPCAEIVEECIDQEPPAAQVSEPEGDEDPVVELSAEEALAFLASLSAKTPEGEAVASVGPAQEALPVSFRQMPTLIPVRKSSRRMVPRRPFKGALDSDNKVLTFESADVDAGMRVAGSTLARLYGLARDEGFDADLGPICQTLDAFIKEWDTIPIGVNTIILANLSCASSFLDWIVAERPQVSEAFWIVYETLRSDVSSVKNVFLAELRTQNRARAIGFGPRNVIEAARRGAEAVRGHVEWGFGGTLAAACD